MREFESPNYPLRRVLARARLVPWAIGGVLRRPVIPAALRVRERGVSTRDGGCGRVATALACLRSRRLSRRSHRSHRWSRRSHDRMSLFMLVRMPATSNSTASTSTTDAGVTSSMGAWSSTFDAASSMCACCMVWTKPLLAVVLRRCDMTTSERADCLMASCVVGWAPRRTNAMSWPCVRFNIGWQASATCRRPIPLERTHADARWIHPGVASFVGVVEVSESGRWFIIISGYSSGDYHFPAPLHASLLVIIWSFFHLVLISLSILYLKHQFQRSSRVIFLQITPHSYFKLIHCTLIDGQTAARHGPDARGPQL
jgi:hypothetical protein